MLTVLYLFLEPIILFKEAAEKLAMEEAVKRVEGEMGREYPLVIGGERVTTDDKFKSINPSKTDEVVGVFSKADAELALLLNRLPRLYHPTLKSTRFLRATDDRFFVVIEARDPKFSAEQTEALLKELDPLSIEMLEE